MIPTRTFPVSNEKEFVMSLIKLTDKDGLLRCQFYDEDYLSKQSSSTPERTDPVNELPSTDCNVICELFDHWKEDAAYYNPIGSISGRVDSYVSYLPLPICC